MATKTRARPPKKAAIRAPRQRPTERRWWPYVAVGAALVVLAVVSAVGLLGTGGGGKTSSGLPNTPDYHSLLVDPSNPRRLVLGTHAGLYVSSDGGRQWRFDALSGNDAMNLARPDAKTIWLAGHDVFKKSVDGGTTWSDVRPSGLPSLDIHGFAVDPRVSKTVYAAVAGRGLYRSADGGGSFALASGDVGGAVMGLAVLPDRRILAADMQRGLLESSDQGRIWRERLAAQLMGLAVNPKEPTRVLATGAGIALSTDGGRTWRSVKELPDGAGPVAWSASDPKVAYVVGFDRTLWRSRDGGATWAAVEPGKES